MGVSRDRAGVDQPCAAAHGGKAVGATTGGSNSGARAHSGRRGADDVGLRAVHAHQPHHRAHVRRLYSHRARVGARVGSESALDDVYIRHCTGAHAYPLYTTDHARPCRHHATAARGAFTYVPCQSTAVGRYVLDGQRDDPRCRLSNRYVATVVQFMEDQACRNTPRAAFCTPYIACVHLLRASSACIFCVRLLRASRACVACVHLLHASPACISMRRLHASSASRRLLKPPIHVAKYDVIRGGEGGDGGGHGGGGGSGSGGGHGGRRGRRGRRRKRPGKGALEGDSGEWQGGLSQRREKRPGGGRTRRRR